MKFTILLLLLFLYGQGFAQINELRPYSLVENVYNIEQTNVYITTPLMVEKRLAEDALNSIGMDRAGIVKTTDLNLSNSGTWFDLPNGDKLWRLKMTVPNALAVNLYFNEFSIPPGAYLFAYSKNYQEILDVFTSENNPESGYYATEYVVGESIYLEYYEPKSVKGACKLNVEGVNGFYTMIEPLRPEGDERAGSCQIDVNCSEGDDWVPQKDAVVKLIVKNNGATGFCSGALLNNTAEDCTPYILSAHHCATDDNDNGASAADFNQWVFVFRHQKEFCGSGFAHDYYSQVGATKLVNSHTDGGILGSDYILLELNDMVDETKAPYFAGWDANNVTSNSGVGIHHPGGDYKKINTYQTALTSSKWTTSPNGTHWRVYWVATANGHGINEGGSSGSPLYNAEGLVIGQLSGGLSECNDVTAGGQTQPDLYGKMSYNWVGSGNIQSLKSYLDPIGNGTTKTMHGNYYLCSQGSGTVNGVEDINALEMLQLFPNPSVNYFQVKGEYAQLNLVVYNQMGEVVVQEINITNQELVDISHLSKGIYFVQMRENGFQTTKRIVKY
ncbi:hypothetical protein DNU06_04170 [Putridiphycobacter roseus]|uniref:Secretion system C-terminal sorting domain-containing protein n=1 Tax=Putridiphycobacter roseus TaxID=2219161 RepID=A0A2W1NQB0_9FLAO|nr:T9SS type A sorting domain-containing protein [Putridiphycobacter roseus]PZE17822.1 hypothetical protein DNU06_04170 [Putridiphycobacter roseus]